MAPLRILFLFLCNTQVDYNMQLAGSKLLSPETQVHPFYNLQSRVRTHAVLVIGLYELLGNPTT
jgi:hypothetical protein